MTDSQSQHAKGASVTDLAIDLKSISKTYRGKVHALREASLSVRRGEIFGLLGPNGAGKSTLVKALLTIVKPSSVRGTMLGARIGDRPTLGRVGYLPENPNFPGYRAARTCSTSSARWRRSRVVSVCAARTNCSNWSACATGRTKTMQTYSKG